MSHRSLYFKHQPRYDVTRVEVRWTVACASDDAARALLARATAATVADFRGALVKRSRPRRSRGDVPAAVAHLWQVAEVVDVAAPQLVAGAFSGVASALWTRDLDLDAARARPRVLAAAVAAALGVAAADVSISVRDAADQTHVAALGRAPLIRERLRAIPAAGGSDALAALGAALDAHFAPPPSSSEEDEEEEEDGDAAAAAAPLLPFRGHRVFMQGRAKSGVEGRHANLVTSLGGAVVGSRGNPTLAILQNDHRTACQSELRHLLPTCRIVRERWLDGVLAAVPLPDFRPHAVYARVGDVRDPGSYFYGAVPDADLANRQDDDWKAIPEDWTPA